MGKKYSSIRLLTLTFVLLLLIFNVSAVGFTTYYKSIQRAAVPQEVLGFSIHEVRADHFKANPYSKEVLLSSIHRGEGYVAISNGTNENLCINVKHDDKDNVLIYTAKPGITYCLLTEGTGSYDILCGKAHESAMLHDKVNTEVEGDEIYTYPNSYVMFSPTSKVTDLCSRFPTEYDDYMNAVCKYLAKHGHYTTEGDRLESWYVPSPDTFVDDFRGDCFDFASFVAAAYRMKGIPCKLAVGTFMDQGHAWIEVKAPFTGNVGGYPMKEGEWCMIDPTVFVSSDIDYEVGSLWIAEYCKSHEDDYVLSYYY